MLKQELEKLNRKYAAREEHMIKYRGLKKGYREVVDSFEKSE